MPPRMLGIAQHQRGLCTYHHSGRRAVSAANPWRRLASMLAPMPFLFRRDMTHQIDTAQELCEGGFTARTTCELVTTSVEMVRIQQSTLLTL